MVRRIKNAAIKSGKIVEKRQEVIKRSYEDFEGFTTCDITEDSWKSFVLEEESFRQSIASKKVDYGRFICKGNYKLWLKVVRSISSIFTDEQGSFKLKKALGLHWNERFVKYCVRVVNGLPKQHQNVNSQSNIVNTYSMKQPDPYYFETTKMMSQA